MRIQVLAEGGGIGDLLMRFGVIRSIKQRFPDAEIWLVVHESLVEWAALDRAITQRVAVLKTGRRPIGGSPNPARYPYLEKGIPFDATIDMYGPADGYENNAFGPVDMGRAAIWRRTAENVLGCTLTPKLGRLTVPPAETELAIAKLLVRLKGRPEFLVGLQPMAHWRWRSLGAAQAIALVELLRKRGAQCLVFHHKTDAMITKLVNCGALPVINEAPATVIRTAELCDVLISVDSALFHLGGTLGVPTLGLFGQTDGKLTGEEYPSCRWITAGEKEREQVFCKFPCYRREAYGCIRKQCEQGCRALINIPSELIVERALDLVAELRGAHLPSTERARRWIYQQGSSSSGQ
jgi:hypothetical protein